MPKKTKLTITERLCESKPAKRIKASDTKVRGLFVSVTPKGVATFYFRYWDAATQSEPTITLGVYHPVHYTIDKARSDASDLAGRKGAGENIVGTVRAAKVERAAVTGTTVDQVIDAYVADISADEVKDDGKIRPRLASWQGIEGYLRRELRPVLGHRIASEITNEDIGTLQLAIAKKSKSNARNTRAAISGMFEWAAQAGRKLGVKMNPCHNLPPLAAEKPKDRVLTMAEIKTLWWGLDRPDVPCTRAVALGLKFELVTMLRGKEFTSAMRDELLEEHTPDAAIRIPLERVKKARVITQPLNSLALEIINEAKRLHNYDCIFHGRDGKPLGRQALSHALIGKKDKKGKVIRHSILAFLGMAKFTPHDLRRTAATLAGDLQLPDAIIAKCLDHSKGASEANVPSVTGKVYALSARFKEKQQVLNAIDAKLREIIGTRPVSLSRAA